MTQDEIIEMAIEARLAFDSEEYPEIWQTYMNVGKQEIEAFAKLVAAKAFQNGYEKGIAAFTEAVNLEREACAKACEQEQEYWGWDKVIDAAKIIRARGEA